MHHLAGRIPNSVAKDMLLRPVLLIWIKLVTIAITNAGMATEQKVLCAGKSVLLNSKILDLNV